MHDSHIAAHGSDSPISTPHQHWRRRALVFCFAGALILGSVGYRQYDPEIHWVDALYHSAQHFTMHGPHLAGDIPWTLELARWLAPVVTLLAAFGFVRQMLREEWDAQRIRRLKRHVIVCGLGRNGLAVARSFRIQNKQVVVIEKSPSPAMAEACRSLGAHLLTGDAANPDTLRAARIEEAESLVALCPDDSTNCEIAAHACHLRAGDQAGTAPLQCRIQVGDAEARKALQTLLAQPGHTHGIVTHFFDTFDPEAQRLIIHDLPLDHDGVKPGDVQQVHLVILGFGRMGRTLAVRAAQLGVFAQPGRLKISVVDRRAEVHRAELLFHYPQITDVCDIEFHTLEAISPETRNLLKDWCSRRDRIIGVAVCFDNEQRTLEIAVQLKQLAETNDVRVAVRMSGQSGLAHLMQETGANQNPATRLRPFGIGTRASEAGGLADDPSEQFARQVHAAYVKMRRDEAGQDAAKLEKLGSDPALRDWDALPEDFRESNRQQAGHIFIKLRALDLEVADANDPRPAVTGFSPAQVEMLAELEHRRWLAERRLANWTFAPVKNEVRRENPNLVAWEKLSEEIKDYDRNAVRKIPDLLAIAQPPKQVVRKDPA